MIPVPTTGVIPSPANGWNAGWLLAVSYPYRGKTVKGVDYVKYDLYVTADAVSYDNRGALTAENAIPMYTRYAGGYGTEETYKMTQKRQSAIIESARRLFDAVKQCKGSQIIKNYLRWTGLLNYDWNKDPDWAKLAASPEMWVGIPIEYRTVEKVNAKGDVKNYITSVRPITLSPLDAKDPEYVAHLLPCALPMRLEDDKLQSGLWFSQGNGLINYKGVSTWYDCYQVGHTMFVDDRQKAGKHELLHNYLSSKSWNLVEGVRLPEGDYTVYGSDLTVDTKAPWELAHNLFTDDYKRFLAELQRVVDKKERIWICAIDTPDGERHPKCQSCWHKCSDICEISTTGEPALPTKEQLHERVEQVEELFADYQDEYCCPRINFAWVDNEEQQAEFVNKIFRLEQGVY